MRHAALRRGRRGPPSPCAESEKSKTAAFSKMRSRRTDLGITTVWCCSAQRMSTWAGVRPTRPAISRTFAVLQAAAARQRTVRLQLDAARAARLQQVALEEKGRELDLVDRRAYVGPPQQSGKVAIGVVAHADRPRSSLLQDALQGPPAVVPLLRDGPVDQVQIDIVEAQSLQTAIEGSQRRVVPLVAVPQFGRHEHLSARHSTLPHSRAHVLLVAVEMSRVDMPVARLERPQDRLPALPAGGRPPDAEAERRHLDAVVESDDLHGCHAGLLSEDREAHRPARARTVLFPDKAVVPPSHSRPHHRGAQPQGRRSCATMAPRAPPTSSLYRTGAP